MRWRFPRRPLWLCSSLTNEYIPAGVAGTLNREIVFPQSNVPHIIKKLRRAEVISARLDSLFCKWLKQGVLTPEAVTEDVFNFQNIFSFSLKPPFRTLLLRIQTELRTTTAYCCYLRFWDLWYPCCPSAL